MKGFLYWWFVEPLVDHDEPLPARLLLALVLAVQVMLFVFLVWCIVGAGLDIAAGGD